MNDIKTDNAYPVFTSGGECYENSAGLTKHQLGAFMIAQGLVSKYSLNSPSDQKIIAQLSYELAAEVLAQFQ
jgi:hypothetical protein